LEARWRGGERVRARRSGGGNGGSVFSARRESEEGMEWMGEVGKASGAPLRAEQLAKVPGRARRVEDTRRRRPATVGHPRSELLNEAGNGD
jgi:hypothetical protein